MHYPIKGHKDDSAIINIAYDSTSNSQIKHVELKYHKKKEYICRNILEIVKIDTKHQLADCLTKFLAKDVDILLL